MKALCLLSISVWINIIYKDMRKDKHSVFLWLSIFCKQTLFFFFFLPVHCEKYLWSRTLMCIIDRSAAALLTTCTMFHSTNPISFPKPPGSLLHGGVQKPGQRHWRLSQTLEEVCRVRVSGKREIPTGMEEQKLTPETVHYESPEAWPHDVRCQVRGGIISLCSVICESSYLTCSGYWKGKKVEQQNLWLLSWDDSWLSHTDFQGQSSNLSIKRERLCPLVPNPNPSYTLN